MATPVDSHGSLLSCLSMIFVLIVGMLVAPLQLQKHMLEDKLNDKISNRPAPEDLMKGGVLHEDPRSPEEKYKEAIEDEYAKREGGA